LNDRNLSLAPSAFYAAKATVTRGRSLAWLAATRGRSGGTGVRILFYHRVSDDRDELAVAPQRFREQMAWLARHGLTGRDVASVAASLRGGEAPTGVIGLSFDDGYRDVVENALPVLEEHGFSATAFISTGVTDGRARLSWYERQPPLINWDEIPGLDAVGALRFESHTVTHANLLALDDAAARAEIVDGKRHLEERLGRPSEVFCYPAGLFGPREQALVREAGFLAATSCEPGTNTPATDPYALRRRQIDARDGLLDFRAKVGGGHDSPPPLRNVYRRLRYRSSRS
jgi:peptidoglycan/xylan/chitin deacetylase (PgdA/CDA1 family)